MYVRTLSNSSCWPCMHAWPVCLPARSNIHSGLLSPETQPSQPTDASSTVLLLSSSGQQRQCRPAFFFQQVAAVPGRQRAQRRTRQRHTHTFSVFIHATDALAGGLLLSSRGPSAFFFLFLFSLPFYIAVSDFVDIAKKKYKSAHLYIMSSVSRSVGRSPCCLPLSLQHSQWPTLRGVLRSSSGQREPFSFTSR